MRKGNYPKIFITGTDTGVGKTLFTTAFALSLLKDGYHVRVVKPVETGCQQECEDEAFYRKILRQKEEIVFYRFSYPASPYTAGKLEGKYVDFKELTHRISEIKNGITLIEGAGGLLVPLDGEHTFLDLVTELNLLVIVVAGNKLGCINHTLLTDLVLGKIPVKKIIVLNDTFKNADELLLQDNLKTISMLARANVAGRLSYLMGEKTRKRLITWIQPLYNSLLSFLQELQA